MAKSQFLVIGAGVGGICSAIDLAEAGYAVTLVEKGPRSGGILPQLDHQFPDDHCGMCRLLPMVDRESGIQTCLKRGLRHDRIRILTHTTVTDLSGQPGNYTAVLTSDSRGVDPERCTRCLECIAACPVSVPDDFNAGAGVRKAVYRPFFGNPGALPTIDWEHCTRCSQCVQACPNQAIDLERRESQQALSSLSGVIVAAGNPLYDPATTDLYGYGVLPNVVTATAFERILSSSGPYPGKPQRPADGKPIHRVAWIQCVGSRNVMIGAGHCSSTCCMFAVKEALLAKEKLGPETETTIFYMDMRTYGRDWQRYRDQAEEKTGVHFIRCRIHSVEPADDPGDLKLTYLDDQGRPIEAVFDLVVLSTGAGVQPALPPFLADKLDQGKVKLIGPEAGLQDIRETVLRAHGAVAALLQKSSPDSLAQIQGPSEREGDLAIDLLRQAPKIQVFLLDYSAIRSPRPDWPAIEAMLMQWMGHIVLQQLEVDDAAAALPELDAILKKNQANRLLIVCNHLAPLRERLNRRLGAVGFGGPLVAWVDLNHGDIRQGSSGMDIHAAGRAIRAALLRLAHAQPLRGTPRVVKKSALVIGAGPAGLSAAVSLADQGVAVHVVEKENTIGGNGPRIRDDRQRQAIEVLMTRASNHPRISIHNQATVEEISGRPGNFEGWIVKENAPEKVSFGCAIIATGGLPAATEAYGLGQHPRVVSHFTFEEAIWDPGFAQSSVNTVVMIQCAGSREEPRNYCSLTCCSKTLENALHLRQLFPDARIVIFYRDIMTPGLSEALYARARAARIRFIPFDKSAPPSIRPQEEYVMVAGVDPIMGEPLNLEADWVSLAVGMVPSPVDALGRMLAIPVTQDGFVREADPKWRPVDTINPGVFVCGLAKGPLPADAAMAEGRAAALRSMRLLGRCELLPQHGSAVVRHAICSRCYLCVEACPYGARFVDPVQGQVEVDPATCQGCGTCAAVCPNSATVMADNEDFTMLNVIEAALG